MMQKSNGDKRDGQLKNYGNDAGKDSALAKCLPDVTPKKPRKNGWQRPWNFSLMCLLFIPVIVALAFLGSFPLCIPFVWRPATYIIFTSLFLIFFFNFLISASINAAEPNVANFWGKKKPKIFPKYQSATTRGQFEVERDLGKNAMVRNNYCYICDAYVGMGAKHCGQCNKCVEKFDHHCIWLNNCVGYRNYRYFIFALVSGILLLLIVVGASTTMILIAVFDQSTLKKWIASDANTYKPNSNLTEVSTENLVVFEAVPNAIFYVYHSVLLILGVVVLCFTGHLLIFHIYLNYNSMTTYDYIVRQRRKQQQIKAATALSSAPTTAREVERDLDNAKSNLAVSNITDNPGYDDFSEVGEEVVDSIEQVTTISKVEGAADGVNYEAEKTNADVRGIVFQNQTTMKCSELKEERGNEKYLMGFETADASYNLSSSTLSNGSSCTRGKQTNGDQDGILVSASAYFRTESLLSEPLSSNKEACDCDNFSNSEDHALEKEEELLSEISVHDTFSGTLSNHLFMGHKMV